MSVDELMRFEPKDLSRLEACDDWSLGTHMAAACLLEAAAPKAGNVHPTASFGDMTYEDFRRSAAAVAPVFDDRSIESVGSLILKAVQVTRQAVAVNTNLGIILLTAPLALAFRRTTAQPIQAEVRRLLDNLGPTDSSDVYAAINLAKAGGLGHVAAMDIQAAAPSHLLDAMRPAAAWDDIALEYATGFENLWGMSARLIELRRSFNGDWFHAICRLQVERLAEHGDTLIARKNEPKVVDDVKRLARSALDEEFSSERYAELDRYLRADGHRRNPGTTADLIAGATFIALASRQW